MARRQDPRLTVAGIWRGWRDAVIESGLPLYIDPGHRGLVRFGHASGGEPPTTFTVAHWPPVARSPVLETDTRLRARRLTTELFDEVGPRCDPLALSRRLEVIVQVDGVDIVAPAARLDGRFVVAVEMEDHDLVVRGRRWDPDGLVLKHVDPDALF